jgi:RHS repeat-associated protein
LRILGNTPHAEIGAAIAIELDRKIHIPVHDLQGNLAALQPLDSDPTTYRYSAFGEESISGRAVSPWRFSSKRTDSQSQLVYFGRRYYIPSFGRWLTPDPAGFTDGMNLYAYVHNSPLTHFDEYGLFEYPPWNYASYKYYSWNQSRWNKPAPIHFRSALNSQSSPVRYVNGILNTYSESISGASALARTFGWKANIIPFHSESWGKWKDLKSVNQARENPNYTSFAVRRLSRELQWDAHCLNAMNDPRKLFINCFSRGAADTYHACKNFTIEQRDRLIITACGPIMTLPRSLGFVVRNLISEGDWCSLHYHKGLKEDPMKYESFANVRLLPQKDGFHGFTKDHFFKSKTYQDGIFDFTVPLYDKHGLIR